MGTTNAGAVDPLSELASFCEEEGLWLHADAAYGGAAYLTEEGRKAMKGLQEVDSLTVDPHKWWFQPYEIGCVLVRNHEHLRETYAHSAEYMQLVEHNAAQINFCDYGVQLTRAFKALKFWMSMKVYGLEAFREAVQKSLDDAAYVESLIRKDPFWELVTPAQMAVLTFRHAPEGWSPEKINELNLLTARKLILDGYAMLSPTLLKGKLVQRLCLTNPRTHRDEFDETIRLLKKFAQETVMEMQG